MAKSKVSSSARPAAPGVTPYIPASKEDKQQKIGGKLYVVTENFKGGGITNFVDLPEGSRLIECNDGFYKVFVDGDELHYRIGKKIMDNLSKKEITQ